jgi:3-dehydroquinate synthase
MLVAAELAVERGTLAERDRDALASVVASLGPLPPVADISIAQVLDAMTHDKKVVDGRLHFVLPTGVGATAIVNDVTEKDIRKALARLGLTK